MDITHSTYNTPVKRIKPRVQRELKENASSHKPFIELTDKVNRKVSFSCPDVRLVGHKKSRITKRRSRLCSENIIESINKDEFGIICQSATLTDNRNLNDNNVIEIDNLHLDFNDSSEQLCVMLEKIDYFNTKLKIENLEMKEKVSQVTREYLTLQSQLDSLIIEKNNLKDQLEEAAKNTDKPNIQPRRLTEFKTLSGSSKKCHNTFIKKNHLDSTTMLKEKLTYLSPAFSTPNNLNKPSPNFLKISQVMEENDIVTLKKLLLTSIMDSEILATKLEEAEKHRLEKLGSSQANLTTNTLNEKQINDHHERKCCKVQIKELKLARKELCKAKERIGYLEEDLDLLREAVLSPAPKRPAETYIKNSQSNIYKHLPMPLLSPVHYVKEIFLSANGSGYLNVTPTKANDVTALPKMKYVPEFQASTPKTNQLPYIRKRDLHKELSLEHFDTGSYGTNFESSSSLHRLI